MSRLHRSLTWVVFGLMLCLGGLACTPAQYAKQADHDAYGAIRSTQKAVLDKARPFSIDYDPYATTAKEPETIHIGDKVISLGSEPVQIITLDEALQIAFRNSRPFQTRKENLYSSALAVTNSSRGWEWPLLDGTVSGSATHIRTNEVGETNAGVVSATPTLTQKLRQGGQVTVGYGLNIATNFTGLPNSTIASLLNANYTQPLLRGAWNDFAYEPQYRLERDFVFAVYDYERYTQTFAAGIVSSYYAVVQQRDQLENVHANIERLRETFALTKVLVEGGQVSRIQQDQAEQTLLNAQVQAQQNQQNYQDALDTFKLLLGLPMRANVELDYPDALDELAEAGPKPIPFDDTQAVAIAFATRSDVLTQASKVRDARRNVEIAADNFLPQLDVSLGITAPSTPPRDFTRIQFDRNVRTASATLNYPIDQTTNRNIYRNSMIGLQQATRDLDAFLDQIRLEVRRSYRSLQQSRTSFELQLRNVEIAKRLRKLASLQQKEGQATARDVLDAEQALQVAQDGLTSALVSYTSTRLQFLATLGMLWIDEKGLIHERETPFKFDAIQRRYPYAGP